MRDLESEINGQSPYRPALYVPEEKRPFAPAQKWGKTIEEIIDTLNVNPTGMLPQIKKLKDEHLVLQEDREYRLTPLADILVEKMEPLLDTLQVIEENAGYWQERDLTALPREFLERLNELKSYFIVRPDPDNIFEPPAIFLRI